MYKLVSHRWVFALSLSVITLYSSFLMGEVMPLEVQNEEGIIYERNMDGTETITAPDGTRIKVMPAGKKIPQLRDTVVQENPDGTDTFTNPDGSVEVEKRSN
jgi:hypothetical protein